MDNRDWVIGFLMGIIKFAAAQTKLTGHNTLSNTLNEALENATEALGQQE